MRFSNFSLDSPSVERLNNLLNEMMINFNMIGLVMLRKSVQNTNKRLAAHLSMIQNEAI